MLQSFRSQHTMRFFAATVHTGATDVAESETLTLERIEASDIERLQTQGCLIVARRIGQD